MYRRPKSAARRRLNQTKTGLSLAALLCGLLGAAPAWASQQQEPAGQAILRLVLFVLGVWAVIVLMRRAGFALHRRWLSARDEHGEGEAPQTALRVSSEAALEAHWKKSRCPCGGRLARPDSREETVRFQERLLLVIRLACQRCGSQIARYAERRSA